MPVPRAAFEAALASQALMEAFRKRSNVFEAFGGNEEETWIRTAKEFGWSDKWTELDGVRIPFGCAPTKPGPKPPEPKVRDKRINVDVVADRESLLRWTQKAIGTDPDTIHPEDIPSSAHRAMLEFANDDRKTFWGWIAELDKRATEEKASTKAFRDDQRRLFTIMDQIVADRERTAEKQHAS